MHMLQVACARTCIRVYLHASRATRLLHEGLGLGFGFGFGLACSMKVSSASKSMPSSMHSRAAVSCCCCLHAHDGGIGVSHRRLQAAPGRAPCSVGHGGASHRHPSGAGLPGPQGSPEQARGPLERRAGAWAAARHGCSAHARLLPILDVALEGEQRRLQSGQARGRRVDRGLHLV